MYVFREGTAEFVRSVRANYFKKKNCLPFLRAFVPNSNHIIAFAVKECYNSNVMAVRTEALSSVSAEQSSFSGGIQS